MRNTTKILTLALPVTALLLAGCTDTSHADVEAAAVSFFKASTAEACSLFAGKSSAEISQCEDAAEAQNVKADPYSDSDYSTVPYAAMVQERGDGYAVLVEAVEVDGANVSEVVGVVPEGDQWKVDVSAEAGSSQEDLCAAIGGECK